MLDEHDELRSLLARIRRRWFGFTALTAIGRATAAAAIPLAGAAAIVWAAAPARAGGSWPFSPSRALVAAARGGSRRPPHAAPAGRLPRGALRRGEHR